MKSRALWVFGIFLALVALLAAGLTLNPREVPSPLVGKAAPPFELPTLAAPDKTFTSKERLGSVWMLNVWASWCVACRDEHPVLVELAKSGAVPIYGLNYKDKREDALRWLAVFQDPYRLSVVDAEGRIGIDYGVYGVPETYLIDKRGVIRYKQIGPVTREIVAQKILPLVGQLSRE